MSLDLLQSCVRKMCAVNCKFPFFTNLKNQKYILRYLNYKSNVALKYCENLKLDSFTAGYKICCSLKKDLLNILNSNKCNKIFPMPDIIQLTRQVSSGEDDISQQHRAECFIARQFTTCFILLPLTSLFSSTYF